MNKWIGRSTLLIAALLLVGAGGYGAWHFSQRSAAASETDAARMIWPKMHQAIRTLEGDVRRGDANEATYKKLGYTYIQAARKTGDGSYEDEAEDAFEEVLDENPESFEAMNGMGMIYLRRHQFHEALEWGRRSLKINPDRARTYGILVDAYVELGQYDQAVETAQKMVNMRPDLTSYSRVSYLRELMGDRDGAIEAMQRAVSAGSGSQEHTGWCRVYLGRLHFQQGNLERAERQYQIALRQLPGYGHALGSLARLRMAQGQVEEAVDLYEETVAVFPIGEYIIALGKAYEAAGRQQKAETQFERAIDMLEAERAGGMDIDEELALLLLERDRNPEHALELAKGAYERRPTVKNADIFAWAQYKNGQTARAYQTAKKALRLGTKEARFHYHAGVIAQKLGRRDAARKHLQRALDSNADFADAEQARQQLAAL
jgi:pentatricopeptide repeat protein